MTKLLGVIPCHGEGVVHIILEVTDEGTPSLTPYRRIILHVQPQTNDPSAQK